VIYEKIAPVHVSGHASQEEMKLLLHLVKPKYFVPIHGELRHLRQHANLAMQLGIPEANIAVIENGSVVEFTDEAMRVADRLPGGYVFVDGSGVGEVGPAVMREREILASDGFVVVNLTLDRNSCRLREEPEIITRGFVYEPDAEDLLAETRRIVSEAVNCTTNGRMRTDLEQTVKAFLYTRTKRRPMVFVTINQG
jgi:ribonuclease J